MYHLYGTRPSFYTRKVAAMLAAMRLPHEDRLKTHANAADIEAACGGYRRFPVLRTPEGEWIVDSTSIGLALDKRHPDKAILPPDPALRIVALMLDDWVDEWLLRAALHWRASDPETRSWVAHVGAGNMLGITPGTRVDTPVLRRMAEMVPPIERFFVKAGEINRAGPEHEDEVIDLMMRSLDLLSAHLSRHPYLLGSRPSLPDFALFGMLDAGLLWEPKPRNTVVEQWPVMLDYVKRMSRAEAAGDWSDIADLPKTLRAVLRYVGQDFAPFLTANAAAIAAGESDAHWDEMAMKARPFTEKCRKAIAGEIAALSPADRERLDSAVGGTGLVDAYLG